MRSTLIGLLADRDSWRSERCSAARALEVLGTASSLLVLREAFYGTTYFQDFVRETPMSEPAMAKRLKELVDVGLLTRVPYQEAGQRTRHHYELTPPGEELMVAFFALMQWGDRHAAPGGGPVRPRHRDCEAPAGARLVCTEGHVLEPGEVEVVAAPALLD